MRDFRITLECAVSQTQSFRPEATRWTLTKRPVIWIRRYSMFPQHNDNITCCISAFLEWNCCSFCFKVMMSATCLYLHLWQKKIQYKNRHLFEKRNQFSCYPLEIASKDLHLGMFFRLIFWTYNIHTPNIHQPKSNKCYLTSLQAQKNLGDLNSLPWGFEHTSIKTLSTHTSFVPIKLCNSRRFVEAIWGQVSNTESTPPFKHHRVCDTASVFLYLLF